ncbi:glutaredoxin family protein [Leucobacter sp. HY1910]
MSAPAITLYSKPSCLQCTATARRLNDHGVPHTVIDMSQDEAALARVKELGYLQAPVIVTPDEHWSGYRPDKIDQAVSSLRGA